MPLPPLLCVPHALSEEPGAALGAQAGEQRLRQVVTDAGFGRFRCVAQTLFNHVYEARPSDEDDHRATPNPRGD
jgi:hypothetical protein